MVRRLSAVVLVALAVCWQTAQAVALPEPEGKVELPPAPDPFAEEEASGVRIAPQRVMLGQAVTLSVRGEAAVREFDKVNLQALKQQFAVYAINRESSRVRLELYPLAAGKAQIEAVKLGALQIPPTTIEVQPNPQVEVVWQAPPAQLYAGQNALWRARVTLQNAAFETRFVADAQSQLLASEATDRSKQQTWAASYQWQLPWSEKGVSAQRIEVDSPLLEVKNSTQRPWRFFDDPQRVEIKPLPSFMPVTTRVGKVDLVTHSDSLWQVRGNLHYWRWMLRGVGVQAEDLKNLAYRLVAELPHEPRIEWLSASMTTSQTLSENGVVSEVEVRLPYRLQSVGLAHLPSLTWRVLDPQSGKMVVQTRPAEFLLAVPQWLAWLLQLAALLGGVWLVWQVWQWSRLVWLKQSLKRQIARADTPQAIWQAMRLWKSQQAGSGKGLGTGFLKPNRPGSAGLAKDSGSLAQFEAWFAAHYGQSAVLHALLAQMNVRFYGASADIDFYDLQRRAQNWASALSVRPRAWRVFNRD